MFKKILVYSACAAFVITGLIVGFNQPDNLNVVKISGSIPVVSKQELILNSDLIVRGKVCNIGESRWSNPEFTEGKRNILQTDITIKIDEVISGDYGQENVIVRINKGYDEESNTKVESEGYPDFANGENVVVFLSRDDGDLVTNEDYFVLTGMRQGKYKLKGNSNLTLKEPDSLVYVGDKGETSIMELKQDIEKEIKENTNYKVEKMEKQEEIRKKI